jgi:hypothetical protein
MCGQTYKPEERRLVRQADLKPRRDPTRKAPNSTRGSRCLLGERLHLAPVPEAVHQVLARADREQAHVGRAAASGCKERLAQLIPGREEPDHLVENNGAVGQRRVTPHESLNY